MGGDGVSLGGGGGKRQQDSWAVVRVQGEESSLSNASLLAKDGGIFWSLERRDWLGGG